MNAFKYTRDEIKKRHASEVKAPDEKERLGRRLKAVALASAAAVAVGLTAIAAFAFKGKVDSVPSYTLADVEPDGYASFVYASDGTVIKRFAEEGSDRTKVVLSAIPAAVKSAFVASQDPYFYSHSGMNADDAVAGLVGTAEGSDESGPASSAGNMTITMRLLANTAMKSEYDAGKVSLAQLGAAAIKLEDSMTKELGSKEAAKDSILEYYLNTVYLGNDCYGVQAAANKYFAKDVSAVSISEACVIAGTADDPEALDPLTHQAENASARKKILEEMCDQGYITESVKTMILADDVYARVEEAQSAETVDEGEESLFADLCAQQVREDLVAAGGYTEEEADKLITSGGISIYGTLDASLQASMELAALDFTDRNVNIYFSVIDASSGHVLALSSENAGVSSYSEAAEKTFTEERAYLLFAEYAEMLETGKLTIADSVAGSDGTAVNVREAIKNCSYLDLPIDGTLSAAGFGLESADTMTATNAAAALAALADGGTYTEPIFYTKVLDSDGNVILESSAKSSEAVSADASFILADAMTDAVKSGTANMLKLTGGTQVAGMYEALSTDQVFFAGTTPLYSAAFFAEGERADMASLELAASMWKSAMDRLHIGAGSPQFEKPATVSAVSLCPQTHLKAGPYCDSEEEYFVAGTEPTSTCQGGTSHSIESKVEQARSAQRAAENAAAASEAEAALAAENAAKQAEAERQAQIEAARKAEEEAKKKEEEEKKKKEEESSSASSTEDNNGSTEASKSDSSSEETNSVEATKKTEAQKTGNTEVGNSPA